ncbi:MAG: VCBS repeat-containing protein [Gemmataceae bacterium]
MAEQAHNPNLTANEKRNHMTSFDPAGDTAMFETTLTAVVFWGCTMSALTAQPVLRFEMQEIDRSLKVGYAVLLADLDGDGRPDILVVDTQRVVWFQNPTWKMRPIIVGGTVPDNVCVDAYDIDGDGHLDLALGAGWRPFDTRRGGTLQWLRRGPSLEQPWSLYPIDEEPSVHRLRFADLDGDGRKELVVVPLMGRGATALHNWMDGAPVRILAYRIPADPARQRWPVEVLDQSLHVVHNFQPIQAFSGQGMGLLAASYEGVSYIHRSGNRWQRRLLHEGNQTDPHGRRGASEIKLGSLGQERFIATIEPWHGHEVVVYTPATQPSAWRRQVIDRDLRWGHAVCCADLDADGRDEIVVGVRDPLDDRFRHGVRIYRAVDAHASRWERLILDNGGIATEDLSVADLDADGRPDIVAVGRATGNVRIYWNKTPTRRADR